ncbi:S8 family serine peptidase [Pseudohongiella sp. SYSU M77423]|uniref:S8 family serine peptidase n=1 Tax=Pseudohongiella sp. SYSU M77423 TaxID=3042312 RepID=UPI002480275B|nr:S8 family serine peptidase [Pseudohongiella sp. SYSU M77423]MDH7942767.1 S8 family serine peptidase [Pseudohongiella sp. SYSU M77423]
MLFQAHRYFFKRVRTIGLAALIAMQLGACVPLTAVVDEAQQAYERLRDHNVVAARERREQEESERLQSGSGGGANESVGQNAQTAPSRGRAATTSDASAAVSGDIMRRVQQGQIEVASAGLTTQPFVGPVRRAAPDTEGAPRPLQGPPRNPVGLIPPLPVRLQLPVSGGEPLAEIEVAPNVRAIERQWVMVVNPEQRIQLEIQAPVVLQFMIREHELNAMNRDVLVFDVPAELDADDAILQLLPDSLRPLMDRNHVYQAQAGPVPARGSSVSLPVPLAAICQAPVSIGIIDSAVDNNHPALAYRGRQAPVVSRSFIEEGLSSPPAHGTSIAGVLIGQGDDLAPVVPNATLYSAAVVYSQDNYRQGASASSIMQALDWLAGESAVSVINLSLTGPANRVLEQGVNIAADQGKVLVAAAGNNGPFAPEQYPSAYDPVVAVTAVAVDRSIYRWANQGNHVEFAALGVQLPTAGNDGRLTRQSGTSLAAPIVAAFFACELSRNGGSIALARETLQALAEDLGDIGRDAVFGYGLLHPWPIPQR